jgi:uncharacterized membrane protein YgcG
MWSKCRHGRTRSSCSVCNPSPRTATDYPGEGSYETQQSYFGLSDSSTHHDSSSSSDYSSGGGDFGGGGASGDY